MIQGTVALAYFAEKHSKNRSNSRSQRKNDTPVHPKPVASPVEKKNSNQNRKLLMLQSE